MPRKTRKRETITTRFQPEFWAEADGRCAIVKEIKRRFELLKADCGADSHQKDMLCQRATFIAIQLETMERKAVEEETFDANRYTVLSNTFLGLLKSLGLERKVKEVTDIRSYAKGKAS
ncbi:hypothetical protein ACWPKS_08510 [Coraliomargarita sp. W4R72]|jgi:hypothetical protein